MEVRDLMSTDVIAVGPKTSIRDAARLMYRYQVSGVPVVDIDDRLLGIVTEGDFSVWRSSGLSRGTFLRMSPR